MTKVLIYITLYINTKKSEHYLKFGQDTHPKPNDKKTVSQ